MKACDPDGKWNENGYWASFDHKTCESRGEFATKISCLNWIHKNYPEDANGVVENVTAEWFAREE